MKNNHLGLSRFLSSALLISCLFTNPSLAGDDFEKFEPLRPHIKLTTFGFDIRQNPKAPAGDLRSNFHLIPGLMTQWVANREGLIKWLYGKKEAEPGPSKPSAPAKPKLPGNVTLKHFWAQNPGKREWALNPPKGNPRFIDGDTDSEMKYALTLVKYNPKIKCDPRKLPQNFSLDLFWLQNPGIREWALSNGKFSDDDKDTERQYVRRFYKWNPDAKWDSRKLPKNFSLRRFWEKNPGIREWALKVGKFQEDDEAAERKYARTYYKWELNAVGF